MNIRTDSDEPIHNIPTGTASSGVGHAQAEPQTCEQFADLVQSVLDGEKPEQFLSSAHGLNCVHCTATAALTREILRYATVQRTLEFAPRSTGEGIVPSPIANDWIAKAANEIRWSRRMRTAVRYAIAASVLLVAMLIYHYSITPKQEIETQLSVAPMTNLSPAPANKAIEPAVTKHLTDASDALAALTWQTTERAAAPTRTLIESAERITFPQPQAVENKTPVIVAAPVSTPPPPVKSAWTGMELPTLARTGLEPVASTTRRAYDLFVRDLGLAPSLRAGE